ncbi:M20 family metallopeptidase [Oceanibaculum pacificum]|uniref:Carboxypeptidase n=1 Tax=Oceanibaculum pacificum TaxID=580166 RepID=A0A154VPW2_9PROT|nr:M20 family metallopeptidase [Oceanibaculum pacificum]KZD03353.1 carboxypeptidase [Oceanibaculum pacificum]
MTVNSTASNQPKIDAEEILEGIRRWVEIESPSHDAAAVNRMVDQVESEMKAIGAKLERVPGRDGWGDILTARTPWGGDGPGILVLSHLDTVHPIGTLKDILPFKKDEDKVFGPGIYDMKGGAYLAYYAYRHLVRTAKETPLPITFMFVPEEEVGSPTSQKMIEQMALKNKYVLVTEPARDGGKIVTSRKGVLRFEMQCEGRPAHAGAQHQDGRSAIKEMAKQILRLEELTNYETGVTCNVGLITGGTGINVVPQHCSIEIDMRVPTPELAEEMTATVLGFTAFDPDVKVTVSGGINRPPYVKDEGIAKLFDHAKDLAAEIGFELQDVKITGGGSDGNFTAAVGVPTLDGLGVDGRGAHTDYEQMYYSSLEPRAKLMLRLFETLQ